MPPEGADGSEGNDAFVPRSEAVDCKSPEF